MNLLSVLSHPTHKNIINPPYGKLCNVITYLNSIPQCQISTYCSFLPSINKFIIYYHGKNLLQEWKIHINSRVHWFICHLDCYNFIYKALPLNNNIFWVPLFVFCQLIFFNKKITSWINIYKKCTHIVVEWLDKWPFQWWNNSLIILQQPNFLVNT